MVVYDEILHFGVISLIVIFNNGCKKKKKPLHLKHTFSLERYTFLMLRSIIPISGML